MTEEQDQETTDQETTKQKNETQETNEENTNSEINVEELQKSLEEANDKYIRLYADFDNFKRISAKNKEELLKYANTDLMSEILTVIDHLELALQHTNSAESSESLAEGVKLTLKELITALEKHGMVTIEALGKPFDPVIHHAMSQIETEEAEENTVVKEFRKGYMLKERILRAPLVGVAKKQSQPEDHTDTTENNKNN